MHILKVNYSRLLKLELPELAERVVGVFETYDPEEYKIKEAYDQLVARQPQIEALLAQYVEHPMTVSLDFLRKKRARYAAEITSQMRFHLKEDIENKEVISAKLISDQFLLYLGQNNEEVINRRITQFFAEIPRNEGLATILDTLELLGRCEKLQLVHTEIQDLLAKRVLSMAARPKGKTMEFAKSIRKALKVLFMQIEVSHTIHEDLDYLPIIDTLNEIMVRYRNLINSRATYNKKKKEGLENEATGETDAGDMPEILTTYVEPTNKIEFLKVEEISENGCDGELNELLAKKKTVVPSSKLVQLPSVNNEAQH